jgi:glycosyltransferase involved in cell wall biosynthesis
MRIALTADPELPVPPIHYGGVERIIDMLAQGLVRRGHDVTLFAHPDSRTAGQLVPWPGRSSSSRVDTLRNAAMLARHVAGGTFDFVHSFSRLAYLTAILPLRIPKLMSYQRDISPRTTSLAHRLSAGSLEFSAISNWMIEAEPLAGRWHMVPNGVPLDTYDLQPTVASDAPLVFLGRLEETKGPHLAVEIARRSGLDLVIAGNIPAEHQAWFEANVAPHIDGRQVRYVGPVNDRQKNDLLGRARAFLMPILWEEPFGIVMAEALACGTPVIGLARGAVPEVVEDGVTGFVCADVDGMIAALGRLGTLDRRDCRRRVERLYSSDAIVDGYLDVYARHLLLRSAAGRTAAVLTR